MHLMSRWRSTTIAAAAAAAAAAASDHDREHHVARLCAPQGAELRLEPRNLPSQLEHLLRSPVTPAELLVTRERRAQGPIRSCGHTPERRNARDSLM